jgi:CheY-like chemotaxis protein
MLPRIFDLFTQANRVYSRAQDGLGIGLTLVRTLVEMHGGSVEVQSEGHGKGSEFTVRLPLASGAALQHGEERNNHSPSLAKRRILVVDDHHDAAESLGMLLEGMGAVVRTAHDGPAALDAISGWRPEIVLLDIGMPGMDGNEVARRARRRPECRDTTLIALTGWGQADDRQKSKEAGFDFHLVKPIDLRALRELLASLP